MTITPSFVGGPGGKGVGLGVGVGGAGVADAVGDAGTPVADGVTDDVAVSVGGTAVFVGGNVDVAVGNVGVDRARDGVLVGVGVTVGFGIHASSNASTMLLRLPLRKFLRVNFFICLL